ncbi:Glycosidase [Nonlabens sp. Hel1_33_55]|uniref:alpha-amylase family glycosyl hydrolase n=1 Tax=Nonlabens sp. Hel1_33_55 TaxID=1336802 RepID=UPI000875C741|nr:alpha-amylase family glycosyl hydrolase [Nonlabens sp. Hel1_33_55]SCY42864.1 Glycosidase [Nonlabens sp. Hel1_33_55]
MKKALSIFLMFAFAKASLAQIQRMEPPNWWTGMEHTQVEVMMYGKDIATKGEVTSDLEIVNIAKTANPNYLFVTVETSGEPAGDYNLSVGKKKANSKIFRLENRASGSKERMGFDSSDVIYLVMPDRFANGDSSNDSVDSMVDKLNRSDRNGRHGGDIQGIIDHLDYIDDLGATAIWSTPMLEDNAARTSYHTYAQSDLYNIDPRYGTNKLYRQLADELHSRDMKLIMDVVPNHWGSTHWMMQDLPMESWIHQFDDNKDSDRDFPVEGYANSSYRQSVQMDPHVSEYDMRYAEKGWFVSSMPDLNQEEPLVLNYLIQNNIWWIEYAGLDGLRVDTYAYNEKKGIADWTKAIMKEYPNINIVGETWLHDQAQISYWQKDSPVAAIQNYNTDLPSVMDFTLHDAIMEAFKEEEQGWDKGMVRMYENFVNDFLYADTDNLLVFMANHDTNRFSGGGVYNDNVENYKLALTLVLTTRGTPQIYYGDEIGMMGDKSKLGDGDIRRDFPGGWNGDEVNAFVNPTESQNEYQAFTKKLLNYRKNKPVLHTGKLLQYVPEQNCYVYFRHNENSRVMVIINNNPEAVSLDMNRFEEGLGKAKNGIDILSDSEIDLSGTLQVAGKTSHVIDLDN